MFGFDRTSWKPAALAAAVVLVFAPLAIVAQNMTAEQQQARQTALELAQQAGALESANRWAEALPLRVRLTAVLGEAFGEGSPETDQGRETLGASLMTLGRYAEARAVWERCLAARTNALGEAHERVADAWLRIGLSYQGEGQLTNALSAFDRAERIAVRLPDDWRLRATVANNQALVFGAQGNLLAAEQHFTNALAALNGIGTPNQHELATVLSGLGDVRRALGRMAEAEADLTRAGSLLSDLPPETPVVLLTQGHLASLYERQGRPMQAIRIYERIVPILTAQRGPNNMDVLSLRHDWAAALARLQDHTAALAIIDDCLERLEKSGGGATPLALILQIDRADRLADLGDRTAARAAYESLLAGHPTGSAADPPALWAARERLAVVARDQGDLSRARDLLTQVIAYRKSQTGGSPRYQEELGSSLLEWVRFQRILGRWDEADRTLREVDRLIEQHLDPAHPLAAEMWTEAGFLTQAQGRTDVALASHRRALELRLHASSELTLPAAESRLNIADVLLRQGQVEAALREVTTAHAAITNLAGPASPLTLIAEFDLASLLHRAGHLDEAARRYEAVLAATQRQKVRQVSTVAQDLAFLELDRHEPDAALRYAQMAAAQQQAQWQNVLRFSSESDRLAWRGTEDSFSVLASVADRDAEPLAQAVFRYKGAVLDSLLEDAQLLSKPADPALAREVAALQAARAERLRLELTAPGARSAAAEALQAARDQTERLESALASRVAGLGATRLSLTVSVAEVQKALPSDAVLIEFVRYERWGGQGNLEPYYGALVLAKQGKPRWCPLGTAATNGPIAQAVAAWQAGVHRAAPPQGEEAIAPLRRLYELLWAPLAPFRPESARSVVVAPDGDLNFVSFATLWDTNHFLGEDLSFRYVACGRDLCVTPDPPARPKTFCVLAAPEYARPNRRRAATVTLEQVFKGLCDVMALRGSPADEILPLNSDLPGTREEAQALAKLARENQLPLAGPFLDKDATESRVRECAAPYVLHLATHGRFLSDTALNRAEGLVLTGQLRVVPRQPMQRSWVALAHANETLDSWRQGVVPDPSDDGLLMADEAARLPLHGTWLVTLSACDTGLGVGRTGEGVLGLRRGFALAGARHLLMTLWPVQDDRTIEFMQAFYRQALPSGDAAEMGQVQGRLLKQWRSDEGAARAARFAGAFVLVSHGL